ncbi:DEAD/DEAH box helicase [Lysobacter brunescens]|uniref:DEAD/DEAH box helicase n=1 Tax=Lysobacter brunescens TaxID=262323 RepID=A0ABW2YDF9_9GAMM
MDLTLKPYQQDALAALDAFLVAARGCATADEMQKAFTAARLEALGEQAPLLPYRVFSNEQPEIPVTCLRIPTGGGKTLMAAHSVERAARLYAGTSAPLALWLVPSDAIRIQTIEALKTPGHPYRDALLRYWPAERLSVLDIADAGQLRAHDFGERAIVLVGTIQTLRVDKTQGRNAYAYREDFEPHFADAPDAPIFERVSEADLAAQPYLSQADIGKIKRSFANLLAWHRPIVIMDEAHNAQSDLSLAVLERIRPACVIEWTATPALGQNVLYHVSAEALKAEDMIKLPIVLAPHPNWHEAVRDAVLTRARLEEAASSEVDYVRPIALFQAEDRGGEVTFEMLQRHLIDAHGIPASQIAIHTGSRRELDGVDLFQRDCQIRFIITVEALKEGWDCSFAYVFCTAQNIRSNTRMEQLLGRVLRMPYARRRTAEVLNRAYAHVCGPSTALVAGQLTDRLISMGFEEMAAARYVQPSLDGGDLFTPQAPQPLAVETSFEVEAKHVEAMAALVQALPDQVRMTPAIEGGAPATMTVTGALTAELIEAAVERLPRNKAVREAAMRVLQRHQVHVEAAEAPSQRGEVFAAVPMLAIPLQGELMLYEPELLTELADYSLTGLPADLPDLRREEAVKPYLIDIEKGKLGIREDHAQYRLDLDEGDEGVSRETLIRALDRRLRRDALLQPDMIAWLGRLLDSLDLAGFDLAYLLRHLNSVADAASERLDALLRGQRRTAFQQSLATPAAAPTLNEHFSFRFDPHAYPARWLYEGKYRFRRHYYPRPGELKPEIDAEETACAIALDQLPQVRFWVRNLERQPSHAFWLPTSTDRFYPDFVAQLDDGRLFVIEYKGGDRFSNDDSREKRTIGQVWASASGGRCVFLMATDRNTVGVSVEEQLRRTIE